jgi:hypothetical protein
MPRSELRQRGRDKPRREHLDGGEPYGALRCLVLHRHLTAYVGDAPLGGLGHGRQGLARVGEPQGRAVALHERNAQGVLQGLEPAADGGGVDAEGPRRARERSRAAYGEQLREVAPVESQGGCIHAARCCAVAGCPARPR